MAKYSSLIDQGTYSDTDYIMSHDTNCNKFKISQHLEIKHTSK